MTGHPPTGYTEKSARGGAVEARWAHNPKVAGSNPAPATKDQPAHCAGFFILIEKKTQVF